MGCIKRKKTEYGGFLPLELNPGKEYFASYEDHLLRYNTVKAALHKVISDLKCKKIYIPYYYCPSTTEAIQKETIEVCFYHIDENLMPVNVPDEEESIILVVDYFGVCGDKVKKYAQRFQKSEIVFDFAHDFFEKPVLKEHRYNVYSAKKFFGVPDGAYLVSSVIKDVETKLSRSFEYNEYLLESYEDGTNSVYELKKKGDLFLSEHYDYMSSLAYGLLCNVDYSRVKTIRGSNYAKLYDLLEDINELSLPPTSTPYHYPLFIRKKGRVAKNKLIEERIYVPTLWNGNILQTTGTEFELSLMKDVVFLPLDQRYNLDDMKFIGAKVLDYWREG